MNLNQVKIRSIQKEDNPFLAKIIRDDLTEFNAANPGIVYFDSTTESLFELFANNPLANYFVAELNAEILGGAGIYPTENLPEKTCELVKMYLSPKARGLGLGKILIQQNIDKAKELGYTQIYLESMPELTKAIDVYKKFGFEFIKCSLGNSGHSGCDVFMTLSI